jgi:enamine deaminase RidA (YjgF/YER057c/UK114 family)
VKVGSTVYASGQIPLDPATGEIVQGPMDVQVKRVFENLNAIVAAAGGSFAQVVKVTV